MLLSRDGIGHIKHSQPYLKPKDLLLTQAILDGDAVYKQGSVFEWIGFTRDAGGQLWATGWKLTRDKSEIRQGTIRRSNAKQLHQAEHKFGPALARKK